MDPKGLLQRFTKGDESPTLYQSMKTDGLNFINKLYMIMVFSMVIFLGMLASAFILTFFGDALFGDKKVVANAGISQEAYTTKSFYSAISNLILASTSSNPVTECTHDPNNNDMPQCVRAGQKNVEDPVLQRFRNAILTNSSFVSIKILLSVMFVLFIGYRFILNPQTNLMSEIFKDVILFGVVHMALQPSSYNIIDNYLIPIAISGIDDMSSIAMNIVFGAACSDSTVNVSCDVFGSNKYIEPPMIFDAFFNTIFSGEALWRMLGMFYYNNFTEGAFWIGLLCGPLIAATFYFIVVPIILQFLQIVVELTLAKILLAIGFTLIPIAVILALIPGQRGRKKAGEFMYFFFVENILYFFILSFLLSVGMVMFLQMISSIFNYKVLLESLYIFENIPLLKEILPDIAVRYVSLQPIGDGLNIIDFIGSLMIFSIFSKFMATMPDMAKQINSSIFVVGSNRSESSFGSHMNEAGEAFGTDLKELMIGNKDDKSSLGKGLIGGALHLKSKHAPNIGRKAINFGMKHGSVASKYAKNAMQYGKDTVKSGVYKGAKKVGGKGFADGGAALASAAYNAPSKTAQYIKNSTYNQAEKRLGKKFADGGAYAAKALASLPMMPYNISKANAKMAFNHVMDANWEREFVNWRDGKNISTKHLYRNFVPDAVKEALISRNLVAPDFMDFKRKDEFRPNTDQKALQPLIDSVSQMITARMDLADEYAQTGGLSEDDFNKHKDKVDSLKDVINNTDGDDKSNAETRLKRYEASLSEEEKTAVNFNDYSSYLADLKERNQQAQDRYDRDLPLRVMQGVEFLRTQINNGQNMNISIAKIAAGMEDEGILPTLKSTDASYVERAYAMSSSAGMAGLQSVMGAFKEAETVLLNRSASDIRADVIALTVGKTAGGRDPLRPESEKNDLDKKDANAVIMAIKTEMSKGRTLEKARQIAREEFVDNYFLEDDYGKYFDAEFKKHMSYLKAEEKEFLKRTDAGINIPRDTYEDAKKSAQFKQMAVNLKDSTKKSEEEQARERRLNAYDAVYKDVSHNTEDLNKLNQFESIRGVIDRDHDVENFAQRDLAEWFVNNNETLKAQVDNLEGEAKNSFYNSVASKFQKVTEGDFDKKINVIKDVYFETDIQELYKQADKVEKYKREMGHAENEAKKWRNKINEYDEKARLEALAVANKIKTYWEKEENKRSVGDQVVPKHHGWLFNGIGGNTYEEKLEHVMDLREDDVRQMYSVQHQNIIFLSQHNYDATNLKKEIKDEQAMLDQSVDKLDESARAKMAELTDMRANDMEQKLLESIIKKELEKY